MTVLDNPRHEAFAQARAKGSTLDNAYENAGYIPNRGHACRLAKRPDVADRIAGLRAARAQVSDASPEPLIARLLRLARAGEALDTAAGMREARHFLMEAVSLARLLERGRIERNRSNLKKVNRLALRRRAKTSQNEPKQARRGQNRRLSSQSQPGTGQFPPPPAKTGAAMAKTSQPLDTTSPLGGATRAFSMPRPARLVEHVSAEPGRIERKLMIAQENQ
jgi:hypothetical protein